MKTLFFFLSVVVINFSFSQTAVISVLSDNNICVGGLATLSSSNSIAGNSPILKSIWHVSGPNGFSEYDTTLIGVDLILPLPELGMYTISLVNQHENGTASYTQEFSLLSTRKPTASFTYVVYSSAGGDFP